MAVSNVYLRGTIEGEFYGRFMHFSAETLAKTKTITTPYLGPDHVSVWKEQDESIHIKPIQLAVFSRSKESVEDCVVFEFVHLEEMV